MECPLCCPNCRRSECINREICPPPISAFSIGEKECPRCCPYCKISVCSNPDICPPVIAPNTHETDTASKSGKYRYTSNTFMIQ